MRNLNSLHVRTVGPVDFLQLFSINRPMKSSRLLIAFLLLLLASCEHEMEIVPSESGNAIIKNLRYSVYQEHSREFIYSSDGRLDKAITKSWYDNPEDFARDTIKFEYDANSRVSVIRYLPTYLIKLFYDGDGNIIQSDFFHEGVSRESIKYFYADHLLQRIENDDYRITFEYDANRNLSTKTFYYGDTKSRIETYLEYDDKPNPFKGNQLIFANEGFDLSLIDYFSNNNPRKHQVEWLTHFAHTDTFSYGYTYNDDGLWTSGGRCYWYCSIDYDK
jgi:YD repeat-containing protein